MTTGETPERIRFFYEKGNHYRVIHVDGAHGGIGPTGRYITMTLWNERRPTPREQFYEIHDGKVGTKPVETIAKEGVFREVEVTAVMDLAVATSLHKWLGQKLEEHRAVLDSIIESSEDGSDRTDD